VIVDGEESLIALKVTLAKILEKRRKRFLLSIVMSCFCIAIVLYLLCTSTVLR